MVDGQAAGERQRPHDRRGHVDQARAGDRSLQAGLSISETTVHMLVMQRVRLGSSRVRTIVQMMGRHDVNRPTHNRFTVLVHLPHIGIHRGIRRSAGEGRQHLGPNSTSDRLAPARRDAAPRRPPAPCTPPAGGRIGHLGAGPPPRPGAPTMSAGRRLGVGAGHRLGAGPEEQSHHVPEVFSSCDEARGGGRAPRPSRICCVVVPPTHHEPEETAMATLLLLTNDMHASSRSCPPSSCCPTR